MSDCELPYLLTYKNSLKQHILYYESLDKITEIIQKIPRYDLLINDVEALLLICRLTEIMIKKTNKKSLDKKAFVVDLYKKIFDEQTDLFYDKLRSDIEFLHVNNKIKGINKFKMGVYYCSTYLKRWL